MVVMIAPAVQLKIHVGVPRQPKFGFSALEIYRPVIDCQMVAHQFQFFHWLAQVGFHVQYVVAARRDPHTAFERNFDGLGFRLPKPQERLHIGFLFEM